MLSPCHNLSANKSICPIAICSTRDCFSSPFIKHHDTDCCFKTFGVILIFANKLSYLPLSAAIAYYDARIPVAMLFLNKYHHSLESPRICQKLKKISTFQTLEVSTITETKHTSSLPSQQDILFGHIFSYLTDASSRSVQIWK